MSLHDELTAGKTTGCKVCIFLANFAPSEQVEWNIELARPVNIISNTAVEVALRKRGVAVTEASIRRHRRNHGSV